MRFAVVGAGVIGRLRGRSVRDDPRTRLVAVVDPVLDAAKRAAGADAKAYATLAEALDAGGLDAVIVSSPTHLHEEACTAAFSAGLHVLCEKPLANSLESCHTILAAAAKAGKSLAVGFNHRYYPAAKFVKDAVVAGKIGRLDHVRVFAGHDGLANFRADWQYKRPWSGGGAMMDGGIHTTDLARHVAGEVRYVYGIATDRVWKVPGSEDNAIAVLRTVDDVPILYQATWTEWKGYQFSVEAYGDLGMVRGAYAPMSNLLITHERPGGPRTTVRRNYLDIRIRERLKTWESTSYLTFREELADFLNLTAGRDPGRLGDGWSGQRALEIADAVYRSGRDARPIELAPRP